MPAQINVNSQPRTPARTTTAPSASMPSRKTTTNASMVRSLDGKSRKKTSNKIGVMALIAIVIIFAGVGTGYLLAGTGSSSNSSELDTESLPTAGGTKAVQTSTEEGINNDDLFPDTATGVLQVNDGSLTNEGTHMLIREGGPDQTAYLFSSYVDLSKYEGKTVEIKGQTNTAQTAGWLLEVGWIKIVE